VELTVRPIDVWPDGWRDPGRKRTASPFRSGYQQTLTLLEDELERLDASAYHLQLDVTTFALRKDGRLRADAKVGHPGVILTIDTADKGVLVYRTDQFYSQWHGTESWHVNLRAIALGLEALRKVDRYGLGAGQQYAGFAALPAGRPMGAGMTVDQAAEILGVAPDIHPAVVRKAYLGLAAINHPDAGGDADRFREITEAKDLLLAQGS